MDDLIKLSAREAVARLRERALSPLELIDAASRRIGEAEPAINALPTLCLERARRRARALMADPPEDPPPGYLHGLPIAVKDLVAVAGVRTTQGSPLYADAVPEHSDYLVETLERNGAVVIAKSNTPEFGAGSHTFNEVFGHTNNPWNTALSAGGSSGGAAAALAAGEVWLATGSDLGGSLRNPASFCSVVGLRPSPGRVAHGPGVLPFNDLPVDGPMARTVGDTALMLDAQVGRHPGDPLSLEAPTTPFLDAFIDPKPPGRVAFSADLGFMPVEPEVAEICAGAAQAFTSLGATVEQACIDFTGAADIFHVLRAQMFAATKADLLDHRDQLKPEVIWNIEAGLALSVDQIAGALRARGALYQRAVRFFEDHDLLLCPAAIVPPFDGALRYPSEVAGHKFEHYTGWLMICGAITLTGCPAASIPCGFTDDGRPVGLQVVGPPRGEAQVISAATLFEAAHDFAAMVPIDPKPGP
ncbi:MAG: amidase family protein [Alphaproteobacteria bacterium]|nr:amidase family protein [Alphaproteobacteria bacterium]MDP6517018.1 amidase family protein [Alphaproteobacteria bacterium]